MQVDMNTIRASTEAHAGGNPSSVGGGGLVTSNYGSCHFP